MPSSAQARQRPLPPPARLQRRRRIRGGDANVARLEGFATLPIEEQERLVRKDVDEPRYAARGPIEGPARRFAEKRRSGISRDAHAVREIGGHLLLVEGTQVILERNALPHLADRAVGELLVELRLAEKDDMQELALLGFEIGEQPHGLQ